MKSRFFVLFCKQAVLPPKMYQRKAYLDKKISESPSYDFSEFSEEEQANQFYEQKLAESHKAKMRSGLETLRKNLKLQAGSKQANNPHFKVRQRQPGLSDNQKQQRRRQINILLEENKIFNNSNFMPSQASINPLKCYEGYFDGCSLGNPGRSGIGYVVTQVEQNKRIFARSQYIGVRTNNQAELIAMTLLLGDCYCNGITNLKVFGDSEIIISGMNRTKKIANPYLMLYINAAQALSSKFNNIVFCHISRTFNSAADSLSKIGAKRHDDDNN